MRTDLPTDTVTFLFTDVEGSTKLLHQLEPERYGEASQEASVILPKVFTAMAASKRKPKAMPSSSVPDRPHLSGTGFGDRFRAPRECSGPADAGIGLELKRGRCAENKVGSALPPTRRAHANSPW